MINAALKACMRGVRNGAECGSGGRVHNLGGQSWPDGASLDRGSVHRALALDLACTWVLSGARVWPGSRGCLARGLDGHAVA